jgi:ABC-2 type transport system permease protein
MTRFWRYAWLSYRGLFTWLNPWGYLSTRVIVPVMLALLFGSLGRYLGSGAARPAVGASLLAVAFATVYGINLAVANERTFGTLAGWLMAPQSLLMGLLGKAAIHIADAMLGAALTLGTAIWAFSLPLSGHQLLEVAACAACAAVSTSGIGVVVAAISVRFRDVFTAPNVAESLLLVTSGAVVSPGALPHGIGEAGLFLPLRHAVQAADAVVAGAALPAGQLGWELLAGLGWGAVGFGSLRWMAMRARQTGSLYAR